jgi:hypothetical protein
MADVAERHMLRQHYRTYLENGANPRDAAPLAAALASRGFPQEGELLHAFSQHGPGTYPFRSSTFPGNEAFVGARPPIAGPGAWWLDSCELSLNILLAQHIAPEDWETSTEEARQRAKGNLTWFAVRPVAVYQYAAFLDVAPLDRIPAKKSSLDAPNLTSADETAPITSLTVSAASLYLYWHGKTFASDNDWVSAEEQFGISPWSTARLEWSGESAFNSSYAVAISRATFRVDPADTEDERDPEKRMLFGQSEARSDTTFRSVLRLAYGLRIFNTPSSRDETGTCVLESHPRTDRSQA